MFDRFAIIFAVLIGAVCRCEQFQISKDNLDKTLVGHSVANISDINHHDCVRRCMSLTICKSINYDRIQRLCQLNDVDKSSVDLSEFKNKKGSIFSDISEWPGVSKELY